MGNITIEEYHSRDRDSCIQLLKSTFKNASNESTFKWRFESNAIKPLVIYAKEDNKIVSFASWIPWTFTYDNKQYTGYQIGEAATALTHRGRGLWSKLVTYGTDILKTWNVDFEFAFPNTDALSFGPLRRGGYKPMLLAPLWVKPFVFPPVKQRNILELPTQRILPPCQNNCQHANFISPFVNEEYIQWRYHENPHQYLIVPYHENDNSAIFFIRERKIKGKIPESILMDVQFSTFDNRFLNKAFRFMIGNVAKRVYLMRTFIIKNSQKGLFLAKYFPFNYSRKTLCFCVKNISGTIPDTVLYNERNWDFMPHIVDDL